MASAPIAFEWIIWCSSIIKSFLKIGINRFLRIFEKSLLLPKKNLLSVSIDIPIDPASWYSLQIFSKIIFLLLKFLYGDFLLNSEIIPILLYLILSFKERHFLYFTTF